MIFGDMFFGDGKLVHEGKAEVLLFCAEVDLGEFVGELLGCFPTDLAAQSGFVARGLKAREVLKKEEEGRFDEVPVFGTASEEGAEPEVVGAGFVDVEDGEVAGAGGGNVEAETKILDFGF